MYVPKRLAIFLASSFLMLASSSLPAFANGIAAWSCVFESGNQKLILTTETPVSSGSTVSIDGVRQSGPASANGTQVSIGIDNAIDCVGRAFTITDNGVTFGIR